MNRMVVASVAVAALAGSAVLGWFEVRQAREFRRLVAVGDAALAHDLTSPAIEAYSGAIALRRDSMVGWLKRGDTYRRSGDFNSALRDLQQAATLDATAPRPIELLGDVSAALGQYGRATEFYARYIGLDDRDARVLYKLALAHYRGGHIPAAIDPVTRAIGIDRQSKEAHYLLGLCEREARRPDQAAAAFRRAVAIDPAFAAARAELAAVDLALGRRRQAIEQLEALAALEPERPNHLIDVAQSYARMGRLESAITTLDRAVDRYPESIDVYLALARVWLDEAEEARDAAAPRNAIQALRVAASQGTNSSEVLLLRGRAQLLSGDAGSAERSLQAATAVLPVDPATFRYLTLAAERLGHHDLARLSRARYAAVAP